MNLRRPFIASLLASALSAVTAMAAPPDLSEHGWKQLSLREKIGQTVVLSSDMAREKALGNGSLAAFFERYPAGGVFLGSWKFEQFDDQRRTQEVAQQAAQYHAASRIPLFMQDDYEQGPGSSLAGRTHLPMLMALGASNSADLARDYGTVLARETRSLGLNWLLNPVADLNLNFLNPVVNTRSISDDPDRALRLLSAQVQAMQAQGLITTIKHFPGDGVDFRDQHLVTTVNSLGEDAWRKSYGNVFQGLIAAGAPSVMIGHITLPFYQKQRIGGRLPPATLSSEIITTLLKGEMGFKGVVISDALNMAGLQGYYPNALETQIQAFKAGIDLMLWPSLEYFDELERRIASGDVPVQRLDDAVARIWALKHRFGLLSVPAPAFPIFGPKEQAQGQAVAERVARASITLLRDRQHQLPLRAANGRKLLLVAVAPKGLVAGIERKLGVMRLALQQRGFEVDVRQHLSYYETDLAGVSSYGHILFVFDRHTHAPMGSLQLYETEALTAWTATMLAGPRVLSISLGDPYVHDVLLPMVDCAINVYSDSPASQRALVEALTGEIGFAGRSPVDLERLRQQLNP